jgi:hypothetical protein
LNTARACSFLKWLALACDGARLNALSELRLRVLYLELLSLIDSPMDTLSTPAQNDTSSRFKRWLLEGHLKDAEAVQTPESTPSTMNIHGGR